MSGHEVAELSYGFGGEIVIVDSGLMNKGEVVYETVEKPSVMQVPEAAQIFICKSGF